MNFPVQIHGVVCKFLLIMLNSEGEEVEPPNTERTWLTENVPVRIFTEYGICVHSICSLNPLRYN